LPIWNEEREPLLREFIDAGFKAIIVVINEKFIGKEWLGREIDKQFIEDLKTQEDIDLCGEKGEYHTFVYDGPIFKEAVKFNISNKINKDEYWFLDLKAK